MKKLLCLLPIVLAGCVSDAKLEHWNNVSQEYICTHQSATQLAILSTEKIAAQINDKVIRTAMLATAEALRNKLAAC